MATADLPRVGQSGWAARAWRNFRRWRRGRPFWGGYLLILSGVEIFLSGNLQLTALEVHFGPEGFQSYVIPLMLMLCGVLTWISPGQRLFYGIVGTLVAVYSLIGVNLGGFFVGMLTGIVGGAFTVAWSPVALPTAPAPLPPLPPHAAPPPPSADYESGEAATAEERASLNDWFGEPGGDRGYGAGYAEEHRPPAGPPDYRRRLRFTGLALVLAVVAAVAGYATVDSPPAYAAPCPPGAAAAAAVAPASPRSSPSKGKPTTSAAPAAKAPPGPAGPAGPAAKAPPGSAAPASPSASDAGGANGGGPTDGARPRGPIGAFFDWLGRLFTGGGDGAGDKAEPAPPPDPPASSAPPGSAAPGAPSGSATAPKAAPPTNSASPSRSAASKAPSPSASACAAPAAKVAAAPGQPPVSRLASQMLADRLTQSGLSFDGVTELPTRGGTVRALKFTLGRSVATNFQLRVQVGERIKVMRTPELTVEGNVSFYATRFSGKLFGLLPVTFTPDFPPPLVLPEMLLTDVDIQLAFVHANTLRAPRFSIQYLPVG